MAFRSVADHRWCVSRKDASKRQRIDSGPSSSPSIEKPPPSANSEDEAPGARKSSITEPKKLRGAAARNNREKELQDRERDREKERADAAGRRKGRAERRRGDGEISNVNGSRKNVLMTFHCRFRSIRRTSFRHHLYQRRRGLDHSRCSPHTVSRYPTRKPRTSCAKNLT